MSITQHHVLLTASALTEALPTATGAILIIFLVVAIGFILAAYAEATARRIKPRRIVVSERPGNDQNALAGAVFLLALLVAVALLMDHG